MERIEIIKNAELKELLLELKEVDKVITEMVTASEEAQEKFNAQVMARQKIVDKMKPVVNAEFVGKLAEFEVLANVTLPEGAEDDTVEVKIVDEVEAFKDKKRKAKEITYDKPDIEEKLAE